jgi:phosphoenolpyruvate synthase/pyruvate phosphate dikinase
VIITALIPLDKAQRYSSRQVGQKSLLLAKLLGNKLPLPAGFVIPLETFKTIAHHNGIIPTAEMVFETADWSNNLAAKKNLSKIKRLIKKQLIPKDIATKINQAYRKIAKKDLVKISSDQGLTENIKGESNLVESILELWADNITKDNLFPSPQIILVQTQPDTSGVISFDSKNALTVQSTFGVFDQSSIKSATSDLFTVDVKTLNVTSHHLNPKKITLKRSLDKLEKSKSKKPHQASLTDQQISKISQLAIKINRQFMGNKKIFFETKGNEIIISDVQDQSQLNPQQKTSGAILIGQSVTGGYIENYPQIATTSAQKKKFTTGHILVTKNLSHQDIDLVKKASAIICEDKTFDRSILIAIKEHHIPCIIGANLALTKLKPNQKIIVDAGAGKVFPATTAVPTTQNFRTQDTITKVYLSAGNPFQAETYPPKSDGIFLKSDYGIALLGLHPEHLIKTKKNLFARNLFNIGATFLQQKPQSFFYRSCNLNSQELSSLKFSENYETPELNPYLGTRGALKIIQSPNLFNLELKTLHELAKKTKKEINFVIPFVRTATELAIIFKKIEKVIPRNDYLKFWLQLNTPANILNLKEFLHLPISGITFQAQTIHDLSYGLDPDNPDLHLHYTFDANLITSFLTTCAKTLAANLPAKTSSTDPLPLVVKLNTFNAQVVNTASQLGARAIVVKPPLFDIVKQQIIGAERQTILKN